MRLDKFLKNSRIIKRRTVAKQCCDQGRAEINGKPAKAGTEIKEGDVIKITFGNSILTVRVLDVLENARKQDAQNMYEVIDGI